MKIREADDTSLCFLQSRSFVSAVPLSFLFEEAPGSVSEDPAGYTSVSPTFFHYSMQKFSKAHPSHKLSGD
jgi:hypothetical protein